MMLTLAALRSHSPAITRLASIGRLDSREIELLKQAERSSRQIPAHGEIVTEGEPAAVPGIVLSGWACRVRQFADGRRQILSLLLPGDLFGVYRQQGPRSVTTIAALTEMVICSAPDPRGHRGLAHVYAVSGALEEAYLFRQIARLGRLTAYERIADWVLETRDRLAAAGLADAGGMPIRLTQEALADTLGLTSVHVNRTLQSLRRDRLIDWRGGKIRLHDPDALAALVEYSAASVTV